MAKCIETPDWPFMKSLTFKGCSWRPIPAHPRCAQWHKNGIAGFVSSRAFDWYALLQISFIQWIWNTLFLVRSYTLKGCSWRPIPAHPRFAEWHNNGMIDFVISRDFDWYAKLQISFFQWIWNTLFLVRSYAFKGCSWRLIPALPRCAGWHNDGTVEFIS